MSLEAKSLTQIRNIAHVLGVKDIFVKTSAELIQEIHAKNNDFAPKAKVHVPLPPYDARLMTAKPNAMCDKNQLMALLQPFIERGLKVELKEETWHYRYGIKNDSGTLRMPLRTALKKAQEILS